MGDARRDGGVAYPEAAQGQLLPGISGASAADRKGAHGSCAGGVRARRIDSLGRQPGEGDGHERHLQKPGEPALRRDR